MCYSEIIDAGPTFQPIHSYIGPTVSRAYIVYGPTQLHGRRAYSYALITVIAKKVIYQSSLRKQYGNLSCEKPGEPDSNDVSKEKEWISVY